MRSFLVRVVAVVAVGIGIGIASSSPAQATPQPGTDSAVHSVASAHPGSTAHHVRPAAVDWWW